SAGVARLFQSFLVHRFCRWRCDDRSGRGAMIPGSLSRMSKKYLSIEEAAAQVGISSAELNRLREKGMIRAFADRGTWKFKEEDVEKLARSRQADSDPEVPLHHEEGELEFSEDEGLASQPTLISKGGEGSDSDVRLIFDDDLNISSGGP